MRSASIVWLTVAVGGSALLSGCGGKDSTGPITPKAVAVVSGNGQTGPGGDDLPDSLRVVVTGSNNQPMAGVSVTWAAGGATISPLTSTTDANGQSAARLSLGAVGPVLVTASVAGLASATFTATAVDPCTWLHVFGVGQTVNGILRQYDCVSNLYFIDYYDLPVSGQQTLAVTMVSNTFDTWLDVWKFTGPYVGANDDDTLSTNSLFKVVAAGGEYVIGANTYNPGDTGPYTLHATTTSPSEEHCEEVWLTRGVTMGQTLSTTDCAATGPTYSDVFWLVLYVGESLDVTATTTAFDGMLQLYQLHRLNPPSLVASDDSVGGSIHLTYTADSSKVYELVATTMTPGGQGAYTLALAAPAASAAAATGPRILASPGWFSKLSRRSLKR